LPDADFPPMPYRVCKSFQIESGHMLSKHPGRCRFPHGHSRRVEVVLSAAALDDGDMVCDFKALKLALLPHLDELDHAMAINVADPMRETLERADGRVVIFEVDPTTEVMARRLFDIIERELIRGGEYRDDQGCVYRFPPGVRLERVRLSETATTWGEYARDDA